MKTRLNWLLGSFLILPMACAHAELQAPAADATLKAEFPATWMEQMLFAYRDFQTTKQNASCFVVETYRKNRHIYVKFLPSQGLAIDGDEVQITLGGANECGRGISYEFDETGKFIRKIYQR